MYPSCSGAGEQPRLSWAQGQRSFGFRGTVPMASGEDFTLQDSLNSKKAVWEAAALKGAASGEAAVKGQQESQGDKGARTVISRQRCHQGHQGLFGWSFPSSAVFLFRGRRSTSTGHGQPAPGVPGRAGGTRSTPCSPRAHLGMDCPER